MSLKVLEVPGEGVRTQAEVSRLGHARRLSHKRMNVRDAIAWFSEQAQFGLSGRSPCSRALVAQTGQEARPAGALGMPGTLRQRGHGPS